jgi:carotenoid cleavage dioxygenase
MGNRYLEGSYAPVTDEVTVTDLRVSGTIPSQLEGRYLRNGPNPISADPETYHWFTGDGMVHGVRLRDGKAAWYRNRWVRNASVAEALGEQWAGGPVHAEMDFAANTNVIGHASRTFAIVEAGARPYELGYELDTIGSTDLDGTLPAGYTAHPKRDPATGELHAVSYSWVWGNKVQYSVIDTSGRVRKVVDVELPASPMLHDMSLTERFAVIYDLPVVFNIDMAVAGTRFPYAWDPDHQARIGLLPRDADTGAAVRWFDVEQCYVFHPMNAYDDGDKVVIDVVRHPRMFDRNKLGPDEGRPTLDRWTVDLTAGKVLEERLDDHGQEFPRVDERLVGQRHRYGYAVGLDEDAAGLDFAANAVFKHDLRSGRTETRAFPNSPVGEVVFVPSGTDAAEDDGVLMGYVYDAERGASDLVLLDAGSLETVATVQLPVRVPLGFHGNWVPDGAS